VRRATAVPSVDADILQGGLEHVELLPILLKSRSENVLRVALLLVSSVLFLTACGGGEPVTEIGLDPVTPPISGSPTPPSTPPTTPPSTPPATPPTTPPTTPPSTPVTGSATLSWIPPTQNEDGSALTNLAGYRIFYGTSAANLNQQINIANPGLTRYVVDNLSAGTWFFGIRAYSATGAESAMSAIASKTIS
jgi:hypothetical protein